MAPFAKYSGKIYPAGLMEKVLRMIVDDNPDVRVFLLGAGASEEAQLDKWGATIERTTSLAGNGGGLAAELALLKLRVAEADGLVMDEQFTANGVDLLLALGEEQIEPVQRQLADLSRGRILLERR